MSKELKLDKSTWVKTKLGELAEEISVRVENPSKSQYDRFVGLDCFVSGELKIKKWSATSNVNSSAKAFKAGDVLFARRNAYLKRASLVELDGCCSGDAFVLSENHDKIVPGFLSFIVNSEKLWTYANSNAEGTMSKRVKWRDLANYEFLLPPKAQQAELADLLWAMDNVIEKDLEVLERLEINKNRLSFDTFRLNKITRKFDFQDIECKNLFQTNKEIFRVPLGWNTSLLKDLVDIANSGFAEGKRDDNGNPQLRMNNVTRDGRLNLAEIAYIPFKANAQKYTIKANDVIFCNTNSDDLVGKTVLADKSIENFYFSNHFTRLVCNDKMLNGYLYLYLKFLFDIGLFQRICVKWIGQAAVQLDSLLNLELLVPSIEEQEIVINRYNDFLLVQEELESKLQSSKALLKALINQVF